LGAENCVLNIGSIGPNGMVYHSSCEFRSKTILRQREERRRYGDEQAVRGFDEVVGRAIGGSETSRAHFREP